jgi:hypothetical protein
MPVTHRILLSRLCSLTFARSGLPVSLIDSGYSLSHRRDHGMRAKGVVEKGRWLEVVGGIHNRKMWRCA